MSDQFALFPAITGPPGTQGPAGTNGTNGTNGIDGSTWYYGSDGPSALHANGDFYIDTSTDDIYCQQSGAWVLVGNIKGMPGGTPAYTDPGYDANTLAYFKFNERWPALAWKNEVTGLYELTWNRGNVGSGGVGPQGYLAQPGSPYGGSIYHGGVDATLVTPNGAFEGPGNALTISMMLNLQSYGGITYLLSKQYRPDGSGTPGLVLTFALGFNSGVGFFALQINNLSGSFDTIDAQNCYCVPLCEWVLASCTYDGTNMRLYLNGLPVTDPVPRPGIIPWQTGANASPWVMGTYLGSSGANGGIRRHGSLWIEGVCRTQPYLLNLYKMEAKRI